MKKIILLILALFLAPLSVLAADLDEMTGQMIILGFKGNTVKSKGFKQVLSQVKSGEISGVIFFEDNIKNKSEFIKMTSALKNSGAKYTPFIAIDMEGGMVARMNSKNGFKDFKTAKEISELTTDEAYKEYFEMAQMLKSANINLNFGPCADLALNKESIIEHKKRSYSDNPEVVIKYAKQFIDAHYENKIITSIKHFPGHGSAAGDTHAGFVDATETFEESELYPYLELSNLNPMQTVMVSHLFNRKLDDTYPASLSFKTIEKFLRVQTDFDGVVITDDLDMGAIKRNYDLPNTVALAINAGENILLFSNREKPDKKLAQNINLWIKRGLIDGYILTENLANSFDKIMKLKEQLK